MPAFYRTSLEHFIASSDGELTGLLSLAYARDGFEDQKTQQTLAWANDLPKLREVLANVWHQRPDVGTWTVLFEFNIPRKMRRIDVVLLAGEQIVLLEQKTHKATAEDCLQAEEYALLLHYFHQPSDRRYITALVVSPFTDPAPTRHQGELAFLETAAYWISPVERVSWSQLAARLASLPSAAGAVIDPEAWDQGAYRPVPTIIQAALSLQSGLEIREIAHSRAAAHEVDDLTSFIQAKVAEAEAHRKFVICFITGVPGSGKTLVGLNLSFSKHSGREPIHFMSGNGPLVQVLQTVLARHQMGNKVRALDARLHAKTLIENVHVFARTYTDDAQQRAPSNHVVIFDEAQRAWNRAQNLAKFKRDYSEPEMLLKIMERHHDWAVVIALVGGGQEINTGEAGLEEWGRSLGKAAKPWTVHASPEALNGGTSVAGNKLIGDDQAGLAVVADQRLHLDVSIRSLRADSYARWVNHVIEGESEAAATLIAHLSFPIYVTRDLNILRRNLRRQTLGLSRCGLVASSQAARLRAEGLEPDSAFHGNYPWEHWYLAAAGDVRSSHQLEVFATEFEIQGLELDWIGLCWGGDFVWSAQRQEWLVRAFRPTSNNWSEIKSAEKRRYRRNAYRVLLTRARQGIALYVPAGDGADATRKPQEFDETMDFLLACGARRMPAEPKPEDAVMGPQRSTLF